jgi:hypothetical protein
MTASVQCSPSGCWPEFSTYIELCFRTDPFYWSHIMSDYSTSNAHKSLEPPLPYPGATPDAERARKPALPESPYKPYAE